MEFCTVPVKNASKGGALKSRTARSASPNYLAGLKLNKQLAAKTTLLKQTKRSGTLKRLAANLSESHEMSKKQTEALLGELVDLVTKHLKKGDRIRIGGLGILVVRKRRTARLERHAETEEVIEFKPTKKGPPQALLGVVEPQAASNLLAKEPAESAYDPSPRALALLRGKKISEDDLKDSGGSYTLQDVETLLGISRQAIDKKVQDGALLAIPGPHGRRRYPTVQFTKDGTVPGLQNVLKSLPSANGWFRLNFLVTPDSHLAGRRPIDVLKEGNIESVLTAAKAIGVQGA
jgi:nucleoid DNA-binding protein